MPFIQLPSSFYPGFNGLGKKPTGLVTIDWDNPLTDGLVELWVFNSGSPQEIVSGSISTEPLGYVPIEPASIEGIAARFDAADPRVIEATDVSRFSNITSEVTLFCKASFVSFNSRRALIAKGVAGSTSSCYSIQYHLSAVSIRAQLRGTSGSVNIDCSSSLSSNTTYTTAVTWSDTDNTAAVYLNGVQENTGSVPGPLNSNSNPLQIGHMYDGALSDAPMDGDIYYAAVFRTRKTATEIKALHDNFWQIVKPANAPVMFFSGAADLNVSANVKALTLTKNQATITYDRNVQAATKALTLSKFAATVTNDVNVAAQVKALTITKYPATVTLDSNVQPDTKVLTLTVYPASLDNDLNVAAKLHTLSLVKYQATISYDVDVQAGVKALTLTKYPAAVNGDLSVTPGTKSLSLTTFPATVINDRNVSAQSKALTLTKYPAVVTRDSEVFAGTKAFTITTYQADVTPAGSRNVLAGTRALVLTVYPAAVPTSGAVGYGTGVSTLDGVSLGEGVTIGDGVTYEDGVGD